MRPFKDNLLAQFSVVTFVIMAMLALLVSFVLIKALDRDIDLLIQHRETIQAGKTIQDTDPFSIPNLQSRAGNLKWITLGAVGGSFLYLYATLVYLVWEGWRTILRQRASLESTNAQLESRVAERVQDLREALEQGRRRLDAFRTAAGRLALEEVPERALQDLVDVTRDAVGARYGALALIGRDNAGGRLVVSGFSSDQRDRIGPPPGRLKDLGLHQDEDGKIAIGDLGLLLSVHGLSGDHTAVDNFVAAPVAIKGSPTGAFYLLGKEGELGFSPDDNRLLDLFAFLAGVHLENVELYDEAAMERSTLAAIQASMTEGLMVLDPAGRVLYLNKTAERLWGLSADDVQGRPITAVFDVMASQFESPESLRDLLNIVEAAGNGPSTAGVTVTSEPVRHLEVTAFPIPGAPKQTMTGLMARDVTHEIDLQRRRNTFVSISSHELRTPMTTVVGFSELLLKRDLPDTTTREWIERIHQSGQILSAIVDDMLNVSRIQSGKLAVSLEHLQLDELVDETLAGIKSASDGHEFRVDIPPETPSVVADREKLSQVLINLLTNAAKYSPGGGLITVSARHEAERDRVLAEVADQGIGIAAEDQKQLFSTFYRIRRPETEKIKGTGLGLNIVKGLVEMMNGEVWVESELNKGTSFFFTIPTTRTDMVEGAWQAGSTSGGTNDQEGTAG